MIEISDGLGDLCTSSHLQLQSVAPLEVLAVVGALSRSASTLLSVAESSVLHVAVLAVLVVLVVLAVLTEVDVR